MCESVPTNDVSGVSVDEVTANNSEDSVLNTDQLPVGDCVSGETDVRELQEKDDSLSACWEMAKAGKGDCTIDNGLLYHSDQVEGQRVHQLCAPSAKLNVVMQMAHNSVISGYLAEKIRKYVQLSLHFVWLLCCILSWCIFVSGPQLGWAIGENEVHAIIWALSQCGGIVCGYQIAVVSTTICCSILRVSTKSTKLFVALVPFFTGIGRRH